MTVTYGLWTMYLVTQPEPHPTGNWRHKELL